VVAINQKFREGFDGRLQSSSLRDIVASFGEESDILHMVGAAAIIRAFKITSQRAEEVLDQFDLSMTRYEILARLQRAEEGRMTLRELKDVTLTHPATMTYTIDGMERRRLIQREADATDRRTTYAKITGAGRRLVDKATAALSEIHFGIFDLSHNDVLELAVILSKLGEAE